MPLIWIRDFGSQKKELKLLRQDVLEEMLESCYDEERRLFWNLQRNFLRGEVTGSWKK